ncbi:hypothetical protein GCM10008904_32500 [Paraclostridium ghonii]|uniref:Helicase ATP-binding domain-containing protein n=1 Tax=Paraclostridium ghonii TaxID=29358 RepID=A0ABU0MWR8_9FIRM|nr:DEAD/DEAH box helicase family protein [Paeniclostridium ghonii]MDQ0555345.1 hypothetical protein [Paeniclostridium ghonii]
MLVITYSTLGMLLEHESGKEIIKYYNLIVFDEIHNLFLYAGKYDNDNNGYKYSRVLQNLNNIISNKTLILGLTATLVNTEYRLGEYNVKSKIMFNKNELEQIISYTEDEKFYINHAPNIIKAYILNKYGVFGKGEKLLIYTNFNKTSEKYKKLFTKYGIKAEWLCSKNTKEKDSNELKMNESQFDLRKQLLEGNNNIKRGILPDDIDVLIINAAYETGWNLYDDRIQHVIIDDTKDYTWIQARNRVRHNIKKLYVKGFYMELQDPEGAYSRCERIGQYNKYEPVDDYCYSAIYNKLMKRGKNIENFLYVPDLIEKLDKKYFNVRLTPAMKEEIKEKYGVVYVDKKDVTWETVSEDLKFYGHIVHTTNNYGTWIFDLKDIKGYMKNNDIEKITHEILEKYRKYLNKEGKKMSEKEELYNYLKTLETIPLNKNQQKELKNRLNFRVDGKQQKTAGKISVELKKKDIPFKIESKRLTINSKKDTYWIVDRI